MTWLDDVARGFDDPAGLMEEIVGSEVEVGDERAGKLTLRFRVRDFRGDPYVATADVYVPTSLADDPR